MSTYAVTIRVVSYYTVSVQADDEEDALGLDPADLLAGTDCDHDALDEATITGAECTEEDDDGECPNCGGSGGGEDRALRCGSCGGSGQSKGSRDDDDREPEPREPREYGSGWEP